MDKDKKTERIGYGYNRGDAAFRAADCSRLFLDTKATKRSERHDMLHKMGLRHGDTVVVVRESDLGWGRELQQIRAFIEAAGATIEQLRVTTEPKKAAQRGMADGAKEVARPYWHLPGCSINFINDRLADKGLGGPYTRQQFIYALGKRGT